MPKRSLRASVDEGIYDQIEAIGYRETRTVGEVVRLLLSTGLRTYRRKSSLRCGFENCTRTGCCGEPGRVVPFVLRVASPLVPETSSAPFDLDSVLACARLIEPEAVDLTAAFCALDRDRVVVAWSRQTERISGVSSEEAVGQRFERIMPSAAKVGGVERFDQVISSGSSVAGKKVPFVSRIGRYGLVDAIANPLIDPCGSGRVIGVAAIIRPLAPFRDWPS